MSRYDVSGKNSDTSSNVARIPSAIASTIAMYQHKQIDEFTIALLVGVMLTRRRW